MVVGIGQSSEIGFLSENVIVPTNMVVLGIEMPVLMVMCHVSLGD